MKFVKCLPIVLGSFKTLKHYNWQIVLEHNEHWMLMNLLIPCPKFIVELEILFLHSWNLYLLKAIYFYFQKSKEESGQGVDWGYCSPHCTEQAEMVNVLWFDKFKDNFSNI